MTRSRRISGNVMKYRFVIYKTKKIIQDSRGKLIYVEAFDNVIYDLFGMKHFCKKLNDCYDDRDLINIIDQIGLAYMMELMNNSKMFNTLSELVGINYRIRSLQKDLRKQAKKSKRDKGDMKEFNYLSNLYKQATKIVRKRLGIKNVRTSYKRKFKGLNDLVNRDDYYYDDDDDFSSILMRDDFGFDDYDDDDDGEYESTSELEDFVNRMNGVPTKSRRTQQRGRTKKSFDNDFEFDPYDDDDDDDDFGIPSMKDDRMKDQVEKLTDTVSDLAAAVQSLMMKDEYDSAKKRRRYMTDDQLRPQPAPVVQPQQAAYGFHPAPNQPSDTTILTDFVQKLSEEQLKMKENQKVFAQALDDVRETDKEILNFLTQLADTDDDEDDVEVTFAKPTVQQGSANAYDRFEDPYEAPIHPNVPEGARPITREELIDEINQAAPQQPVNPQNTSESAQ